MNHETQLPPLEFDAPNDDFDAFFLSTYDSLTRSLTAAFGDRELASEAVQEAFVRANTRWRRVRRLDNPAAWVRRVAINLLRDQHRRRGRRDRAIERLAAMTPTHTVDPDRTPGTASPVRIAPRFPTSLTSRGISPGSSRLTRDHAEPRTGLSGNW